MIAWVIRLGFWSALAWSAGVSAGSAQQQNPEQIQYIKDTAVAICNTIVEAKGQKSEVQITGEINAYLGGLVGKIFNIGGSGKGSLTREQFEGLSREATATALEGDRGCRERVFNKMFDKISAVSHPDQKTSYIVGMRRADLQIVRTFLRQADPYEWPLAVAASDEYKYKTDETESIVVDDNIITVVGKREYAKVKDEPDKGRRRTCSAKIAELDDVIRVPDDCPTLMSRAGFPSELKIHCLSGKCASCKEEEINYANIDIRKDKHRNYTSSVLSVSLGSAEQVLAMEATNCAELHELVRALSRIISSGSDAVFCKAIPSYCNH